LRNGRCYRLETSALRIVGRGYGSLRNYPTPTVQMHKHGAATEWEKANRPGHLHVMVATWPTPSGDDANNATRDSGQFQSLTRSAVSSAGAAPASPGAAIRRTLPNAWRTPGTQEGKGGPHKGTRHRPDATVMLRDQVGGQLNPDWVEWLMGYPIGFTACAASGIASSRKSLKPSRGRCGASK